MGKHSVKKESVVNGNLPISLRTMDIAAVGGQQYCGSNGDADVVGLPGIHIECKRVERLNIEDAMRQAVDDTGVEILPFGEEIYPAVFHRRNRGTWLVTMRLEDWIALYKEWEAGRDIDSR